MLAVHFKSNLMLNADANNYVPMCKLVAITAGKWLNTLFFAIVT